MSYVIIARPKEVDSSLLYNLASTVQTKCICYENKSQIVFFSMMITIHDASDDG